MVQYGQAGLRPSGETKGSQNGMSSAKSDLEWQNSDLERLENRRRIGRKLAVQGLT
jgi:hypothetical protein